MGGGCGQPLERGHVVKSTICVFVNSASHQFQTGAFSGPSFGFPSIEFRHVEETNNGLSTKEGPMRTDSSCSSFSPGTVDPTIARVDPPLNPPGRSMRLSLPDELRACVIVFFFALVAASASAVPRGPSGCVFSLLIFCLMRLSCFRRFSNRWNWCWR
jgi:hypothetical protein